MEVMEQRGAADHKSVHSMLMMMAWGGGGAFVKPFG